MRSYRLFFWFVSIAIFVTACSSSPPPLNYELSNNYRYGDYYMRDMNKDVNDQVLQQKEAELRAGGVQIVSVGQIYKIIVPADILFYKNSPRIQWTSYALLNDIAPYIRTFNKIEVAVAGFTESTGNPARDRALSINRARNVANYLWEQAIGANIIYVQGYVIPCKPERSKVEISFRSLLR